MRVDIEKRHINSYEKIAREANKAVKKDILKVQKAKYKRALFQKNISAENKKKGLAKSLHGLIISTFSLDIGKVKSKKRAIEDIKLRIALIRVIIHKIKAINNYIEEALLRELGIVKKPMILKAIESGAPARYIEKSSRMLSKGYAGRIEHTVYELMQRIIFFDKRLLKDYRKKEARVVRTEKLGISGLERILRAESELLNALEAKMPPGRKVKAKLFKKETFSRWVPMAFALLSCFEAEYSKETSIFLKIKKNGKLRKKIEKKIKHVVNEKENLLRIKEKRALAMKSFGKISDDYRQTFHEYVSAAGL